VFSLSHCFVFLPTDQTGHHPASLILPMCTTIHSIVFFSQHSTMTSWSGDEHNFDHELWHQQSPDFKANFPMKGKSDFRSMREVRSYTPKQTVSWSRCSRCILRDASLRGMEQLRSSLRPYQEYIDYLEDVVIYNLKRELSEELASPDSSSSAGDNQCCKCSTCTCGCHKKITPPPPRNIGPLHLHLHLHLTWVLLHAVATLRRLYALRAILVQLD
jgi:hypothetical protein